MGDRRLLIPPSLGVACSGLRQVQKYYTDVLLQPLATPLTGLGAVLERLRKQGQS